MQKKKGFTLNSCTKNKKNNWFEKLFFDKVYFNKFYKILINRIK